MDTAEYSARPIDRAIKQATRAAFRSGAVDQKTVQAREALVRESQPTQPLEITVQEKLLDVVPKVSRLLRELGFPNDLTQRANTLRTEIARWRAEKFLQRRARQGPIDWVWKTIQDLDPAVIDVTVANPNPGEVAARKFARSSGLEPGTTVWQVDARRSQFLDFPGTPEGIILGGRVFRKETVLETLRGKRRYHPVFRREDTHLPLVDTQTGRLLWVSIPTSRVMELEGRLRERPTTAQVLSPLINFRSETHRLIPQETPPENLPPYDTSQITYGVATEASPRHPNEDGYANFFIYNNKGEIVGIEFVSIDGSGGALDGRADIPENEKSAWIIDKVNFIKKEFLKTLRLSGRQTLEIIDRAAIADKTRNPAYAGVVAVRVYANTLEVARKGDQSVVLWRETGFEHERGRAWGANRGKPSPFQSVDIPQNTAYRLLAAGMGGKTGSVEDLPAASDINAVVGLEGGKINVTTIERSKIQTEYLLVLSDGGRGSGALVDTDEPYCQEANTIMQGLARGEINETQAAKMIIQAVRKIPGEDDDVTIQIIKLPQAS